jgi:hypothetical protein
MHASTLIKTGFTQSCEKFKSIIPPFFVHFHAFLPPVTGEVVKSAFLSHRIGELGKSFVFAPVAFITEPVSARRGQ